MKKIININDFHDDVLFRYSDHYIDQYVELQITQDIVRNEFFNKKSVIGMMSCHDAKISDFVLANRAYPWQGGDKPPVPDGVKIHIIKLQFEELIGLDVYSSRQKMPYGVDPKFVDWNWHHTKSMDQLLQGVISYEILGLVDDGELGYEEVDVD